MYEALIVEARMADLAREIDSQKWTNAWRALAARDAAIRRLLWAADKGRVPVARAGVARRMSED
jgi:hypothetical protein